MNTTTQSPGMQKFDAELTFRLPTSGSVVDAGQVRVGGFGPAFRHAAKGDTAATPVIADAGKVRVGGFGPLFR